MSQTNSKKRRTIPVEDVAAVADLDTAAVDTPSFVKEDVEMHTAEAQPAAPTPFTDNTANADNVLGANANEGDVIATDVAADVVADGAADGAADDGFVVVPLDGVENVEIEIATKALINSMHDPLTLFLATAGMEVFDGDLDRWFKMDGFGSMSAKKMEDIGECFLSLAKLRDTQNTTLPVA